MCAPTVTSRSILWLASLRVISGCNCCSLLFSATLCCSLLLSTALCAAPVAALCCSFPLSSALYCSLLLLSVALCCSLPFSAAPCCSHLLCILLLSDLACIDQRAESRAESREQMLKLFLSFFSAGSLIVKCFSLLVSASNLMFKRFWFHALSVPPLGQVERAATIHFE